MGRSRIQVREESTHIWYMAIVRHYEPSKGFRLRLMLLTPGRKWLAELEHERVLEVGPYEAAVELFDSVLEQLPWYESPGEVRVNDSKLAARLGRVGRWRGFAIVDHDHDSLEDARRDLQEVTEPKGVVVWV